MLLLHIGFLNTFYVRYLWTNRTILSQHYEYYRFDIKVKHDK